MGNELEWPDRIGETIEKLPEDHPTKIWAVNELKKRGKNNSPAKVKDLDELYLPFVKAFFQKCKAAIEKELPGTLFRLSYTSGPKCTWSWSTRFCRCVFG